MSSGNGRRIHFGDCRADAGLVKTASYFLVLCPLASFAAGYFSRYADFFVDRFALLGTAPQHRKEIFRNAAIPASEGGRCSCGFGLRIGAAGAQRELDRKIRRGG